MEFSDDDLNESITGSVTEGELDEARKRKTKRKAKSKRHSSPNRSPVPRFYGAWGFGDFEGGDGGGE
jgi:hypothetical protein